MTQRTLRVIAQDAQSVTYADPNDVSATTRVRTAVKPKVIENQKLSNIRNEIISNKVKTFVIGDDTVSEDLSVRVSISGSSVSEAALILMWGDIKQNVDALIASGSLKGFPAYNVALITDKG